MDPHAPDPLDRRDREDANVALTTIAATQGVWGVRVHQVRGSLDAIRVVERWSQAAGRVAAP